MSISVNAQFDIDYTIVNEFYKNIFALKNQVAIRQTLKWHDDASWMSIIRFKLLQAIFVNEFLTLNFRQNQVTTRTFLEQIATQFITKDIVQSNDISTDFFRAIITHLFQLLKNYATKFIIKSKSEKEFASNSLNSSFFSRFKSQTSLKSFSQLIDKRSNSLVDFSVTISTSKIFKFEYIKIYVKRVNVRNVVQSELFYMHNFFETAKNETIVTANLICSFMKTCLRQSEYLRESENEMKWFNSKNNFVQIENVTQFVNFCWMLKTDLLEQMKLIVLKKNNEAIERMHLLSITKHLLLTDVSVSSRFTQRQSKQFDATYEVIAHNRKSWIVARYVCILIDITRKSLFKFWKRTSIQKTQNNVDVEWNHQNDRKYR